MANVNTKAHVLVRDGFVCQICGRLLLLPQAIKVLDLHAGDLDLYDAHGKREPLRTRWATVDHIVPEIEGGMDVLENLVACCVPCNSRKGGTCGQLGERRQVPGWDGLSGLFLGLGRRYEPELTKEDRSWLQALCREQIHPRTDHVEPVVACLRRFKSGELDDSLDAALPSILDKVFKGGL